MRTSELVLTVDSERVVPDHPASRVKADLLSGHFEFCRKVIADSQPECAVILENSPDRLHPIFGPGQIIFGRSAVIVDVVLVANIEGRIGKCQINRTLRKTVHSLDAVFGVNLFQFGIHILLRV